MAWRPTEITRFVESRQSSTQVVIVDTDAGLGYLKAMGNPEGEHALACDLVGTKLAQWFGLRTFDQAIINVDDIVDIQFFNGNWATPGPAVISRAENGDSWGGEERQLGTLANKGDISRLVVFDTWVLNRDRHFRDRVRKDNVFLSGETENHRLEVVAMDHTHCFAARGEITPRVNDIAVRQDNQVYGLFPEFRRFLDRNIVTESVTRLAKIERANVSRVVDSIPREWDVSADARSALADLIVARAAFVADNIVGFLWPQRELDFTDEAQA